MSPKKAMFNVFSALPPGIEQKLEAESVNQSRILCGWMLQFLLMAGINDVFGMKHPDRIQESLFDSNLESPGGFRRYTGGESGVIQLGNRS